MNRICLNRSVLDFMAERISRASFVLEFGAGWSSRWFADRCGVLLSVDTSKVWAEAVRANLQGSACRWKVDCVPDPSVVLVDCPPDLVLVDCAQPFRAACARVGWRLLKHGGWLVFDDAQRPENAAAVSALGGDPVRLEWSPGDVESARQRLALAWRK